MTLIEQLPSSEPRRAQLHYRLMMGGWWLYLKCLFLRVLTALGDLPAIVVIAILT